jgi:hypothetical protein
MAVSHSAISKVSTENWIRAGLVLVTLVAYVPALSGGFVFDDTDYVENNPHVTSGLSADNFVWAWTTGYQCNWHPLTWLSLQTDSEIFGSQNLWGYHLTNVLVHIANTLLLFSILRGSTGAVWESASVAGLFALHPLHVESVAWITERKDILSTFFGFLAINLYFRYVKRPAVGTYLPVLATYALSLLAKPMLVTLPFVLLLLDYWPLRREASGVEQGTTNQGSGIRRKAKVHERLGERDQNHQLTAPRSPFRLLRNFHLLDKVPLLLLSIASSTVTVVAQHTGGAVSTLERFPIEPRIFNALISYVVYLGKMIWPLHLSVYYPIIWPGLPHWQPVVAAIILAVITIFAVYQARRRPYLLAGWLWYLGTLVPVIGLVQVGIQSMADRYTYLPLVGIFVMVTWTISDLSRSWHLSRARLTAVAGMVLVACTVLTWRQSGYWHDQFTLYTHAAEVIPDNVLTRNMAGSERIQRNLVEEAFRDFSAAVALDPHFFEKPTQIDAWYNLGLLLEKQGRLDEAERAFQSVLKQAPNDEGARAHIVRISEFRRLQSGGRH